MGKSILFLLITIFVSSPGLYADEFKITYERNEENNDVVFKFEKTIPGSITVRLEFSRLENTLSQKQVIRVVKGQKGTIFVLRPTVSERRIGFSYNYTYVQVPLVKKVKEFINYAIPFRAGSKITVEPLSNIESQYFGAKNNDNWTAFKFNSSNPDSVYSSRAGIVTDVSNSNVVFDSVHFSSNTNFVLIEHSDGTLAVYRGFDKNDIQVKVGSTVYPGDLLGTMDPSRSLHFLVYYVSDYDFDFKGEERFGNRRYSMHYVNPVFVHGNGKSHLLPHQEYIAELSPATIFAEMSKKERKTYLKTRN